MINFSFNYHCLNYIDLILHNLNLILFKIKCWFITELRQTVIKVRDTIVPKLFFVFVFGDLVDGRKGTRVFVGK